MAVFIFILSIILVILQFGCEILIKYHSGDKLAHFSLLTSHTYDFQDTSGVIHIIIVFRKMNLDKADLSIKDHLMKAIQQSDNEEIMRILSNKIISGQELVELTDSKIISSGLTSNQKKELNLPKPLGKYISTNVFKCNTEVTKDIPIKSMNVEVTRSAHKNLNSINEISPAMNIPGKNIGFLQELKSLLSQARPTTEPLLEDMPVNRKQSPSTPIKLSKSLGDLQHEKMYQVLCIPILPIKQKFVNNIKKHEDETNVGPDFPEECYGKKTKILLPVLSQVDNGKQPSKPSLLQSRQKDSKVANRKPIPLPTRAYCNTGSLGKYLDEMVCEPLNDRKCITQTVEKKTSIEPDNTGKYLSGNDNIAEILRDKNLNGQELLGLTELKIINWRLTSAQKKELFTFINNLEVNPSSLMAKYIPTNVYKSDTEVTKSTPVKSIHHELTQKSNSNSFNSTTGTIPETGILEKKANFVQELNSLLSGALGNPLNQSTIPKNIETDSNQARLLTKPQIENLPVVSSNQTSNILRSMKDDTITSNDHKTPILSSEISHYHQKESMNLLLPIAQPLQQNVYRTSPKPNRKPLPPRPGQAKSMGDLVNGWDQAVTPIFFKQNKGSDVIKESSKKEMGNLLQPILGQIVDAESSSGNNLLKFSQNASSMSPEVNRKPIPLPIREIIKPPTQFLDQSIWSPTSPSNYMDTRKYSLPILSQINSPKGFSGPSLLQSPENVPSMSTEVNRKPIPLPTRGSAQPLGQNLDQAVCAPLLTSKKKVIKNAKENKYGIEQDANVKYLESDSLRKKEELSPSKVVDLKEGSDSTTKFSTFYIPLANNSSQGTDSWVPNEIDDHGYLQLLQHPVDQTPVPTHPKEYENGKKLQTRNDFHFDLSKAVKEKFVKTKVKPYVVQKHSHLSLIITPPSSDDELFDENQEEKYTNRSVSIKGSTTCNKVGFQPLPRPPTRMVTPEFIDDDGYFECVAKHDSPSLDNQSSDHYHMYISGKQTKQMLRLQQNGSFLFRPSRKFFLVLTIKHSGKLYNFGIDLADDGKIYLNGESGSALGGFSSLPDFINYFRYEPITFLDDENMIEIYINPNLGPKSFSAL